MKIKFIKPFRIYNPIGDEWKIIVNYDWSRE